MSTPRINRLLGLVQSAALALVLCAGLVAGLTPAPGEPAPLRTMTIRPAAPVETLTHQLEQAYEMDQIAAGAR